MRKIYTKEEGIASTVGTIFALMIFTALLGMFMTQVVPVTMKENEAHHDQEVLSQLSNLRSVVDILTMTGDTNYTAYVPIKLGADGIPFFASPTYGQLGLYPSLPDGSSYLLSMKFTDKFGNIIWKNSTGSLQFIAPNKYYVSEVFEYANGAILRYNYQSKSAVFSIDPNIRFENQALGYALNFTGSSGNYVSVPHDSRLDITGPITVEAWVYIRGSGTAQRIVMHNQQYILWIKSNNGIRFADTHGHYVDTPPLDASYRNKWIHIAAVFSGKAGDVLSSSNAQIYINGRPMGASWGGSWSPSSTTSDLRIGQNFDGYIDEVRILNRALTQEEIYADYYAGHHYSPVYGTAAWYHFDEGAGNSVGDSSGNNLNGTINGGSNWILLKGVNIAATMQNIYGTPAIITGTETRSIGISMQGISEEKYNVGGTLTISVKDVYKFSTGFSFNFTKYWIQYMCNMLNRSGLSMGIDYTVSGDTITIFYVENANLRMVYVVMDIER